MKLSLGVAIVALQVLLISGGKRHSQPATRAWPWQAILESGGEFVCGAVVVGPRIALTAAHCVSVRGNVQPEASTFTVRVGDMNRKKDEGTEQDIAVTVIYRHPKFDAKTFDNDIALLFLAENANVEAVAIVGGNLDDLVGQPDCFITGYGSAAGKKIATKVQEAAVSLISNSECAGRTSYTINEGQICPFDEKSDKAPCVADSGSPLVCKIYGFYQLVGLSSFGFKACSIGPSVYSRLSFHRAFLDEILEVIVESNASSLQGVGIVIKSFSKEEVAST